MQFDALLVKVIEQALSCGIPVSNAIQPVVKINTRAKKRYGCCKLVQGRYEIELSETLLHAPEQTVCTVLAHEVLHTCKDCMNHGGIWKTYAAVLNRCYGYEIKRTAQYGQGEAPPVPQVRYMLRCESCGTMFARQKMSKLVRYPARYRCRCGGKLSRIL